MHMHNAIKNNKITHIWIQIIPCLSHRYIQEFFTLSFFFILFYFLDIDMSSLFFIQYCLFILDSSSFAQH